MTLAMWRFVLHVRRWGIRILLALALLLAFLVGWLFAEPVTHRLAIGRFHATDQEAQECYFAVNRAMVILDPRGEMCVVARSLVGSTGELVFIKD